MVWGWIGVALALVSAWLGGELIETHGISVEEKAHPDAPSSLSAGEKRAGGGRRIPVHREA